MDTRGKVVTKTFPRYTVVTNVVSPESQEWIGTCWEFFNTEEEAVRARVRQAEAGNVATMRSFNELQDTEHLGAAHRT